MRISLLVLLSVAFLSLFSCKKSNESDPVPPTNLTKREIKIWSGKDTLLVITGTSTTYNAVSENEDIVQVVMKNNELKIVSGIPGTTKIRISDETNTTVEIDIHVLSFSGNWRNIENNASYKGKAIVQTGDPALTSELTDSLTQEANLRYGVIFGGVDQSFVEVVSNKLRREGTYSFTNLRLTFTSNGTSDHYTIIPFSETVVAVSQDLTAYYQSLYPGKNVTRVVMIRYLRFVPLYG